MEQSFAVGQESQGMWTAKRRVCGGERRKKSNEGPSETPGGHSPGETHRSNGSRRNCPGCPGHHYAMFVFFVVESQTVCKTAGDPC